MLILGSDDGLQKTLLRLKRFVLELGLRLQPRDIRFRLHQRQPRHSRILHLSKRLRLRFRMRRPKRSRFILCRRSALIRPTAPPTPRIRLTLFALPLHLLWLHLAFTVLRLDHRPHRLDWHR